MIWHIGALTEKHEPVINLASKVGLVEMRKDLGMILNYENFRPSKVPSDFSVREVAEPRQVRDWLIPFAAAYDLSNDTVNIFENLIQNTAGRCENTTWLIGYENYDPVSTAYLLLAEDIVLIYGVATLPAARRRGYARAIMDEAVRISKQRYSKPIALYASEMGYSLYREMGFEDLYELGQFALRL